MFQMLSPRFGGASTSGEAEWKVYDVQVPPGSLGVVLHETPTHPAVIEKFAPLDRKTGTGRGALELHGSITPGSVIIGVNEHDFVASKMTMKDIGRVLSQTSNVTRTVRVQVPTKPILQPARASSNKQPSESDSSKLLKDIDISSSDPTTKQPAVRNVQVPPAPVGPGVGLPPASPQSAPRAPSSPRSNVLSPTSQFSRVTSVNSPKAITVRAPPGPLGLNLDGAIIAQAVVLGFNPLPDGSKGALERHGGIVPGAVLVGINSEDVSKLNREQVQSRLVATAQMEKLLTFQVPTAPSSLTRSISETGEDLNVRRREELGLVMKYDESQLKRKECWFLIDMAWMRKWANFIHMGGPLPGPITNGNLLEDGWEKRLNNEVPGRPDVPKKDLFVGKDYTGVGPMVWCLLTELHGAGRAPVLARYTVKLYEESLSATEVSAMLREPKLKAADLAKEIRERSMVKNQQQ